MSNQDDDRFRVRPGAPKNRQQKFVSQVLEEVSRAGGKSLRKSGARPGARLGRGHVAARFAGRSAQPGSRRVTIKTRLVNIKQAGPRSNTTHLRYIERDGVGRDGEPGQAYGPTMDDADLAAFEEHGQEDRHQFRFIISPEDAEQLDDLRTYTRHLMARMEADLGTRLDTESVLAFLLNRFSASIDVTAQATQAALATRHLSNGLATWVPRITSPSNTFVIEATAGSGKTQLALTLIQQALQRQERVAYVCFTRPLADHVVTLVSHKVDVCTVHEWALQRAHKAGMEPDFSEPGVFDAITRTWTALAETQDANLDLLIVDESQDFDAEWIAALTLRIKSDGRLYLMGDAEQVLYGRDAFELPDAVQIHCDENFRSPRRIVATVNALRLTATPVQAMSAFEGDIPEFVRCGGSADGTVQATEKVLHALWDEGYAPEQVVVLNWHGGTQSPLLQRNTLAGQRVCRWLGRFDAAANPVFSEGPLRAETVHRFKGQSAPVIVLSGLDFTELTPALRRRLFVAMTRAQYKLVCVANQDAMDALGRVLAE
jgi:hypothetical protein